MGDGSKKTTVRNAKHLVRVSCTMVGPVDRRLLYGRTKTPSRSETPYHVIGNADRFIRIANRVCWAEIYCIRDIEMQVQPVPVIARRMMVLLCTVVAIDAVVALLAPHPAIWCAVIPSLITLLTPVAIFYPRAKATS